MKSININYADIENFSTIFTSIILEAIPFILLGAFISALIQVFVSEEFVAKVMPKNKLWAYLGAALMGLIFPVCECAIVPIAKRLIKKGVPVGVGVTFMLAVPIVNPVVLMSTYYAFQDKTSVVIMRGAFGLISSIIIGLLVSYSEEDNSMSIKANKYELDYRCSCGCGADSTLYKNGSKLKGILEHTVKEFLNISKYLILGAFLSGLFQVIVDKKGINSIGTNQVYSILIMMLLAFCLSICSEADAFIARTFLGKFTLGSIVAFLILGPMIDIKNALMLFGNFKGKLVMRVIIYIILITFAIGCLVNIMNGVGVI